MLPFFIFFQHLFYDRLSDEFFCPQGDPASLPVVDTTIGHHKHLWGVLVPLVQLVQTVHYGVHSVLIMTSVEPNHHVHFSHHPL